MGIIKTFFKKLIEIDEATPVYPACEFECEGHIHACNAYTTVDDARVCCTRAIAHCGNHVACTSSNHNLHEWGQV